MIETGIPRTVDSASALRSLRLEVEFWAWSGKKTRALGLVYTQQGAKENLTRGASAGYLRSRHLYIFKRAKRPTLPSYLTNRLPSQTWMMVRALPKFYQVRDRIVQPMRGRRASCARLLQLVSLPFLLLECCDCRVTG